MDIKKEDIDVFEKIGNWIYGIVAAMLGAMWTIIKYIVSQKEKRIEERFTLVEKKIDENLVILEKKIDKNQVDTDNKMDYFLKYLRDEKQLSEEYKDKREAKEEERLKQEQVKYDLLLSKVNDIGSDIRDL